MSHQAKNPFLVAVLLALVIASCGGGEPSPAASPTTSTRATVPAMSPTALPADIPEPSALFAEEDRLPFEPEMVFIPSGEFSMGSDPSDDPESLDGELPQHSLFLPAYCLAKTPVTNSQYAVFLDATGHHEPYLWRGGQPPRGKEDHPVVNVSWHDATAYCLWLAEATGKPYRLPSEAEWEKGARGSDGRVFPWGSQWDPARCNCRESTPGDTTPVGSYPGGASPYGALDMAGNVWEWTSSLYGTYPYDPEDGREDSEAPDALRRVLRGGSFANLHWRVRSAFRGSDLPGFSYWDRGFRVALDAGQSPAPDD